MPFICKYFGHKVDRHRVWNDGVDFRTSCARCGEQLIRAKKWREYDPEVDGVEGRKLHPREQARNKEG